MLNATLHVLIEPIPFEHITSILEHLYEFLICYWVQFRLLVFAFKAMLGLTLSVSINALTTVSPAVPVTCQILPVLSVSI